MFEILMLLGFACIGFCHLPPEAKPPTEAPKAPCQERADSY